MYSSALKQEELCVDRSATSGSYRNDTVHCEIPRRHGNKWRSDRGFVGMENGVAISRFYISHKVSPTQSICYCEQRACVERGRGVNTRRYSSGIHISLCTWTSPVIPTPSCLPLHFKSCRRDRNVATSKDLYKEHLQFKYKNSCVYMWDNCERRKWRKKTNGRTT